LLPSSSAANISMLLLFWGVSKKQECAMHTIFEHKVGEQHNAWGYGGGHALSPVFKAFIVESKNRGKNNDVHQQPHH
jgi:hypothetical protein